MDQSGNFPTMNFEPLGRWGGGWLPSSSCFNPNEICHIHLYNIQLYHSISVFPAHQFGSRIPRMIENRFFCTLSDMGGWLPISSSFNPDETCYKLVYTIYLCRSTSDFMAQELVFGAEDRELHRYYIALCPPTSRVNHDNSP